MALYNTLALRGILIQGSSWCWQFSASKRPFFFFFLKEENGVGYLKIQKIIKNDAPPGLTAERTTRSRVLLSTSRQHAGARRSSRDGKLSSPENPKVLCSTVCTSNTAHVVNEIKAAVMSFFSGGSHCQDLCPWSWLALLKDLLRSYWALFTRSLKHGVTIKHQINIDSWFSEFRTNLFFPGLRKPRYARQAFFWFNSGYSSLLFQWDCCISTSYSMDVLLKLDFLDHISYTGTCCYDWY